jgi:hypothetical protein
MHGGEVQILNFQNIFHWVCNEIRRKIQSGKNFRNPTVISTRLIRISTCKISACYDKAHLKILFLKILSCKVQFSCGFCFRGFFVTFTRVLAVTRKRNVAGVFFFYICCTITTYYDCMTVMALSLLFLYVQFYLYLDSFCLLCKTICMPQVGPNWK